MPCHKTIKLFQCPKAKNTVSHDATSKYSLICETINSRRNGAAFEGKGLAMVVSIEVKANSTADALVGLGSNLEAASTDDLIAELRQRLVKQDPVMVLKIVPFAEPSGSKKKAA